MKLFIILFLLFPSLAMAFIGGVPYKKTEICRKIHDDYNGYYKAEGYAYLLKKANPDKAKAIADAIEYKCFKQSPSCIESLGAVAKANADYKKAYADHSRAKADYFRATAEVDKAKAYADLLKAKTHKEKIKAEATFRFVTRFYTVGRLIFPLHEAEAAKAKATADQAKAEVDMDKAEADAAKATAAFLKYCR